MYCIAQLLQHTHIVMYHIKAKPHSYFSEKSLILTCDITYALRKNLDYNLMIILWSITKYYAFSFICLIDVNMKCDFQYIIIWCFP